MILLDTDILTLLMAGNPRVVARLRRADDEVAITVITKVEILRGRFDFLLKAEDGDQLQRAQLRLDQTELELLGWNVVRVNPTVAQEFSKKKNLIVSPPLAVTSVEIRPLARIESPFRGAY